jgi:colanic acid biosynthesis glycosyl transferase WcaI
LRILLHGLNYAPELTGIGKYSGEMAEWLASRGHEVRVVTAPPYYPAWRIWPGYRAGRYSVESGPVRVYRCPVWVPRRPSGHTRLLHLISFALSSLPVLLRLALWRPDVVIVVEPTIFCAPAALLVARLAGGASWLHIQDFEIDAAFELDMLPSGIGAQRMAVSVEQSLMRHFTRVSTISRNMLDRLRAKGTVSGKAILFPNWVDVHGVVPGVGVNRLREELGLGPDKVVLLYSGNMGMKQGLELLPELARRFAENRQVHFVFCGDGAFRPRLEALLDSLHNVTLLPLQPLERLNELLSVADIHLLPQRSDAADLVMPSKLTGMLASGRPVVATAAPGTQVADAVKHCGIAVEPGNVDAVVHAIQTLVNSPELRARMGAKARQNAVENLGRDRVLGRFESELRDAVLSLRQGRRPHRSAPPPVMPPPPVSSPPPVLP